MRVSSSLDVSSALGSVTHSLSYHFTLSFGHSSQQLAWVTETTCFSAQWVELRTGLFREQLVHVRY
nr:hypothetical protein Q903MT_gene618 [Picea sitchensis]